MAYEIYKFVRDRDDYFDSWENKQDSKELNENLKEEIYNKYLIKCNVFQRDDFTCQNENCPYCHNIKEYPRLTMHHIKFVKNNGADKERNCVTLCRESHKEFHRGKDEITIWGKTYQIHVEPKTDWKRICKENKRLRKQLKYSLEQQKFSAELIRILMNFLTVYYKDLQKLNKGEWSS